MKRSDFLFETRTIIQMVREFTAVLSGNWSSFPSALRDRFMKCLIDRVEIRGDKDIEATIFCGYFGEIGHFFG
jgi:hypothetical protein